MNFLYTFVETFFIDYFVIFIFSLFNFKNRRLITFLLITIGNLLLVIFFFYEMIIYLINYKFEILTFLFYILDIISVLSAYTLIMIILLRGVRIFKSRRLKKFQDEFDGKNHNKRNIILSSILLIFGLTFLTFGILLITLIKKYNAKYVFSLILLFSISIILITISILLLSKLKFKKKNIKERIMFVVIKDKRIFLSDDKIKEDILSPLESKYFLTDFGYLYFKEAGKNICYHIKGVEALDNQDYINIDLIEDNKFIFILNELEKYNKKEIYLDENFIIKRMKNIN